MTWARAALVATTLSAACGGPGGAAGMDAVPASRDVRVGGAVRGNEGSGGYVYVASRPLAVVALAEARGIDPDVARHAIDRVADALDACSTAEGRRGLLSNGAARIVATIEPDGSVGATNVHIDAGSGAAQTAVLCLVAPVRLLVFPAREKAVRAVAIEALWGRGLPAR